MRISDLSSDVCSSDLNLLSSLPDRAWARRLPRYVQVRPCRAGSTGIDPRNCRDWAGAAYSRRGRTVRAGKCERPRADRRATGSHRSSEERRVGKSVSVRVTLGGSRIIKKKLKNKTKNNNKNSKKQQ